MDLFFDVTFIKGLLEAKVKSAVFRQEGNYIRSKTIDSRHILIEDRQTIRRVGASPKFKESMETRRLLKRFDSLEVLEKAGKGAKVVKLEMLAEAFRASVDKAPRRWVFREGNYLLPYAVTGISYHKAEGCRDSYTPAFVRMELEATSRGHSKDLRVDFHKSDLPGTVGEILAASSILLATDKLCAEFDAETAKYQTIAPLTGEQFLGRGEARAAGGGRWERDTCSLERDGQPSKLVMDDSLERGKESGVANMLFWGHKARAADEVDEDDDPEEPDEIPGEDSGEVMLPAHPFVRAFNLGTHGFVDVHVSNLEPYVYDAAIVDKLVLPEGTKRLIDALTGSVIERMSDVVAGKALGIIVLCSGAPGTGKTLTAEVYSEAAKRPLYMVQCSQLGTDENQLETHLAEVLERATRWRAILLIDEADVYIHERGDDIQQNAIVGVFLRLLEYYNGILFLTTNRATIIDDAILSRTTAHVKYQVPGGSDSERLWKILLQQYGVTPTTSLVTGATSEFKGISGRSIRQLVRLGLIVQRSSGCKTFEVKHLLEAAKFQDLETRELSES